MEESAVIFSVTSSSFRANKFVSSLADDFGMGSFAVSLVAMTSEEVAVTWYAPTKRTTMDMMAMPRSQKGM